MVIPFILYIIAKYITLNVFSLACLNCAKIMAPMPEIQLYDETTKHNLMSTPAVYSALRSLIIRKRRSSCILRAEGKAGFEAHALTTRRAPLQSNEIVSQSMQCAAVYGDMKKRVHASVDR